MGGPFKKGGNEENSCLLLFKEESGLHSRGPCLKTKKESYESPLFCQLFLEQKLPQESPGPGIVFILEPFLEIRKGLVFFPPPQGNLGQVEVCL